MDKHGNENEPLDQRQIKVAPWLFLATFVRETFLPIVSVPNLAQISIVMVAFNWTQGTVISSYNLLKPDSFKRTFNGRESLSWKRMCLCEFCFDGYDALS